MNLFTKIINNKLITLLIFFSLVELSSCLNSNNNSTEKKNVYSDYLKKHELQMQNLPYKQDSMRDSLISRLNNNPIYLKLVKEKIVDSKYIPVIDLINKGIISQTKNGFDFREDIYNRLSYDENRCAIEILLLMIHGGLNIEQLEMFERYKNKYGYYGTAGKVFVNENSKEEKILYDYDFLPLFSVIDSLNKEVANDVYKVVALGIEQWESNKDSSYLYPYLSNEEQYEIYLRKIDPQSPYINEFAFNISAEDLAAAYNSNEVAGDRTYAGKRLRITGTVESINKDVYGKPYAILTGYNSITIRCNILSEDLAAMLKKGFRYHITGICKGLSLTDVVVKNCIVEQ